jgi:hypothetical protein
MKKLDVIVVGIETGLLVGGKVREECRPRGFMTCVEGCM